MIKFTVEVRDFEVPEAEETLAETGVPLIEEAVREKIERTIDESPVVIVEKEE